MKLLGVVLILMSAGSGYAIYYRSTLHTLRLMRAIADDLPLLQCRICIQHCSIPVILAEDMGNGLGGKYLWKPLAVRLAHAEGVFYSCWERVVHDLPPLIAQRLMPLGKLLPVGGDILSSAIDEIRGDLLQLAHEQQERQKIDLRLSAAVCFSGAALFILIFL